MLKAIKNETRGKNHQRHFTYQTTENFNCNEKLGEKLAEFQPRIRVLFAILRNE